MAEASFTLEDVYEINNACFNALVLALEEQGMLQLDVLGKQLRQQIDGNCSAAVAMHLTGFADALEKNG
jgi:hypothetical protein